MKELYQILTKYAITHPIINGEAAPINFINKLATIGKKWIQTYKRKIDIPILKHVFHSNFI